MMSSHAGFYERRLLGPGEMTGKKFITLARAVLSVSLAACTGTGGGGDATTATTVDTAGSTDAETGSGSGSQTSGGGTDTAGVACWQVFTEPECVAQGSDCEFVPGGFATYVDGTCAPNEGLGWCAPIPYGGSQTPSAWFHAATGRVFALAFTPFSAPPGWELCAMNTLCDPAPSAEACQVCLCEGGTSTGGTGSSTGG